MQSELSNIFWVKVVTKNIVLGSQYIHVRAKHFNSMGHNGFLNNFSITLIDKTDGRNSERRKDYWRKTLKTYSPFGLNVEDLVILVTYLFSLMSWGSPVLVELRVNGLKFYKQCNLLRLCGTAFCRGFYFQ